MSGVQIMCIHNFTLVIGANNQQCIAILVFSEDKMNILSVFRPVLNKDTYIHILAFFSHKQQELGHFWLIIFKNLFRNKYQLPGN